MGDEDGEALALLHHPLTAPVARDDLRGLQDVEEVVDRDLRPNVDLQRWGREDPHRVDDTDLCELLVDAPDLNERGL